MLLGGAINLGLNATNSKGGSVSSETYIVFIVLQCLAPFVGYLVSSESHIFAITPLLSTSPSWTFAAIEARVCWSSSRPIDPSQVWRPDGTRPNMEKKQTFRQEMQSLWSVIKRKEILLLWVVSFSSAKIREPTFEVQVSYFDLRSMELSIHRQLLDAVLLCQISVSALIALSSFLFSRLWLSPLLSGLWLSPLTVPSDPSSSLLEQSSRMRSLAHSLTRPYASPFSFLSYWSSRLTWLPTQILSKKLKAQTSYIAIMSMLGGVWIWFTVLQVSRFAAVWATQSFFANHRIVPNSFATTQSHRWLSSTGKTEDGLQALSYSSSSTVSTTWVTCFALSRRSLTLGFRCNTATPKPSLLEHQSNCSPTHRAHSTIVFTSWPRECRLSLRIWSISVKVVAAHGSSRHQLWTLGNSFDHSL